MDTPDLAEETFAERERLVGLLEQFDTDGWATASPCDGWRVREVVTSTDGRERDRTVMLVPIGLQTTRFSARGSG